MEILQHIYHNFYSVCALIPAVFMCSLSYYFLSLKERSKASLYFGLALLFLAIFFGGYFLAAASYHPDAAYHRWLTIGSVLPAFVCMTLFNFHFPDNNKNSRLEKILLISLFSVSTVSLIVFIAASVKSERLFHFSGHYWDFNADVISAIVSKIILAYLFIFIITGIWKATRLSGREKKSIIAITVILGAAILVPAIANDLSREGVITRGSYQVILDLMTIIGFFSAGIIFINVSSDRSFFLAKVTGVTLATILLIFQGLSYFSLQDKEHAYNMLAINKAELLNYAGIPDESAQYLVRFHTDENLTETVFLSNSIKRIPDFTDARIANSIIYENIKSSDEKNLEKILETADPRNTRFFAPYRKGIEELSPDRGDIPRAVTSYLRTVSDRVSYQRDKLQVIEPDNFTDRAAYIIRGFPDELSHFRDKIEPLNNSNKPQDIIKAGVLEILTPVYPAGKRFYGTSPCGAHQIRFIIINEDKAYETGLDYISYREFLHSTSRLFIPILFFILLFSLVGFRFFFQGAFVTPLNNLVRGMKFVMEGDFNTKLKVRANDEIGYITRHFNNMVVAIGSAREHIQDYAENLEKMVEERTSLVQKSFDQQTGDYYLTSLLVQPLAQNNSHGINTKIDFFTKGRKSFVFKNKEMDIGGDICMAHNLILKGRLYSVFMNADAMGKSIQGAGGALVVGAIFQSLIIRVRFSSVEQEQHPENWLKKAYLELRRAFETFDGSMMISLVMGLVDDELGVIYYLNAEHPWTVLYRNKQASFIENELSLRKLGVPDIERPVVIKIFRMLPGDMIITGSDGRDDIILNDGNPDIRVFNEDENLFLKVVEQTDCSIPEIYRMITSKGKITDDFSLLRISYMEHNPLIGTQESFTQEVKDLLKQLKSLKQNSNFNEAKELLESNSALVKKTPVLIRELIKLLVNKKEFEEALPHLDRYIEYNPENTRFMYMASYLNRKTGNWKKAAEYGERAYLRNPYEISYILNLARTYIRLKMYTEADMLIDEALRIDPENSRAANYKNLY